MYWSVYLCTGQCSCVWLYNKQLLNEVEQDMRVIKAEACVMRP